MNKSLPVIGKACKITIVDHAQNVPAKVDTGADSSSIWASNISIDKSGVLHFTLFAEGSEFYTGEVISRKDFKVAQVTSSNGHAQIRYRVYLTIKLEGKTIRVLFNLSDRSRNVFPILIGRRTITGKFLVDVSRGLKIEPASNARQLNKELEEDPHAFFQKYHGNE